MSIVWPGMPESGSKLKLLWVGHSSFGLRTSWLEKPSLPKLLAFGSMTSGD